MENIDINQIAITIADKVADGLEIKIALIGAGGVICGAFIAGFLKLLSEWFQNKPKKKLDKQREELLRKMLSNEEYSWRKMSTLSGVIGASEEETKRLLINIKARGSETEADVWGLIEKNPLPKTE